ncbi:hypothetical protein A2164_04565 [Candidatus Curtissbacteria bacterium RBG_13_35_7]|uniref:DUF218 domain-containing protein n=1 Tax=Candidatus Curtissbacteria bacterium RBG_13_35_7 TaxID=1797705 RepID=A0A1F5G0E9_9BACT|nr:MAG: hypothetical protein A2164_04565 [Candidatus Curtissbacteria bacterium RBG_13_35_7]
MEDVEKQSIPETELKSKAIGILLTAGAVEKVKGGYRIEPNLEGKVRALGALDDLANEQIDTLFVVGGAKSYDKPLARYYKNFLRRFIKRYNLTEGSIEELPGGVETGSDLKAVIKQLQSLGLDKNLRIYSTGFHLERAQKIMKILGYKVTVISTEDLTRTRSKKHPGVVDNIITPEFIEEMNEREKRIMRLLAVDSLPVMKKLRLGLKICELLAKRQQNKD